MLFIFKYNLLNTFLFLFFIKHLKTVFYPLISFKKDFDKRPLLCYVLLMTASPIFIYINRPFQFLQIVLKPFKLLSLFIRWNVGKRKNNNNNNNKKSRKMEEKEDEECLYLYNLKIYQFSVKLYIFIILYSPSYFLSGRNSISLSLKGILLSFKF